MRKKEGDKENDILKAAIEVFAERGFHDTKIHSIADRAGIATGTVYLYFGNKENILLRIFETFWEQIYHRLASINKSDILNPIETYNTVIDSLFDYFSKNPSVALLYINEQNYLMDKKPEQFTTFYNQTLSIIESYLIEGVNQGFFKPSINMSIASCFFLGGFRLLLHEWVKTPHKYKPEEVLSNIKALIFTGITGNSNNSQIQPS